MNIIVNVVYVLLTLLGVSSGTVKIMGMKDEMRIFNNAGFSSTATVIFGIIQVVATLMIWHPTSRKYGAIILAITFIIATGVLFVSNYKTFGVVSLLFIAMAVVPLFRSPFES